MPSTAGKAPAPAAEDYEVRLRLRGSNTIGRDLAPALAEQFLTREGATSVHRVELAPDEFAVVGSMPNARSRVAIDIRAHGSGTAFEGLASGEADLGMASRRIKLDERRALARLGDLTSPSSEHVLALDGVAVVVNQGNPVDSLSLAQLRGIFAGELQSWAQVGGRDTEISLYARDEKSGTTDTFRSVALDGRPISGGAARFEDSQKLSSAVAADPNGIGFVGLAYVGDAKALKVGEGTGIAYRPTVFTVRTEAYRLARRLYLYSAEAPNNPWVNRFVAFSLSDAGQAIVDAVGFVGQGLSGPSSAAPAIPSGAPPEYIRLVEGATRMALDFRFESGSDRLDNKALRDVGRLVQTLSQSERRSARVLLFGFADAQGDDQVNARLSRSRADAVLRELRAEGIEPDTVRGFGAALPVAGNDTDEGRARNRRVEVWIR
jgi:phosphate transport system substrate-binding protein